MSADGVTEKVWHVKQMPTTGYQVFLVLITEGHRKQMPSKGYQAFSELDLHYYRFVSSHKKIANKKKFPSKDCKNKVDKHEWLELELNEQNLLTPEALAYEKQMPSAGYQPRLASTHTLSKKHLTVQSGKERKGNWANALRGLPSLTAIQSAWLGLEANERSLLFHILTEAILDTDSRRVLPSLPDDTPAFIPLADSTVRGRRRTRHSLKAWARVARARNRGKNNIRRTNGSGSSRTSNVCCHTYNRFPLIADASEGYQVLPTILLPFYTSAKIDSRRKRP
ncbi:hypothetical protein B0H19DRAFT_1065847 [Mycena capillaripes]|nr:hypothetical protein B0H19DRAFT_1065847 [Mycena capillaripes]